ncbi:MAG: HNH endonuclease, partial [Ilumatobacteraceae bacterium]
PQPQPQPTDPEPADPGDVVDPQPADPQPDPEPEPVAEWLSLSHLEDGGWQLAGRLDADHGAIVETALREARDALFQRDGHRASGVDGLVEISNRSLDTITDPARRDRYRIHLHLDPDNTMIDGWGRRLPGWLRDLVCCDTILSTVNHHNGLAVSVGRTQRTIPERTRRLVVLRDRGCRVPGCATERVLQVHHIIHWDPHDGEGPTDTWNLICLCPRHHRMHHQGLLGISGNADQPNGLTFTDTHGRPIAPGPRPRPPTGPPPPPTGRYRHPLGERLQTRWVVFNPPRPTPTTTHTN